MGHTTLLRALNFYYPDEVKDVETIMNVSPHIDTRVLTHIHFRTHSMQTSHDPFYDNIAFIASSLLILSPESIAINEKGNQGKCQIRDGVCASMCEVLGMSRHLMAYYTPHARHYYAKNPTFRETVDGIVRRYK